MSRVSSETILTELHRYYGSGFYKRILAFVHTKLARASSVSAGKRATFIFVILLCSEISISLLSPAAKSIRLIPPPIDTQIFSTIDCRPASNNFKPLSLLRNFLFFSSAPVIGITCIEKILPRTQAIKKVDLPKIINLPLYLILDYRKIRYLFAKVFARMCRGPPLSGIESSFPYLNMGFLPKTPLPVNSLILFILFFGTLKFVSKNVILKVRIAQYHNLTFLEKGKPSERTGRKAIWPTVTEVTTVAGLPKERTPVYTLGLTIEPKVFCCPVLERFAKDWRVITMKPKVEQGSQQRVIAFLNRCQVDSLDNIGKDSLFSIGTKLSRARIISCLVDLLVDLDINGNGIGSIDELKKRITERMLANSNLQEHVNWEKKNEQSK